jgi:hypothetical protein
MLAIHDALLGAQTQHGESLERIGSRGPLLIVFLRHFG